MSSPYVLQDKFSESSSTSVYKAFHTVLNRTVLLKILHKHLAADKQVKTRFEREARALATFRSENIVQVYDLTEVDGSPAIVMEFVEGKSLANVIASEGKLPLDKVQSIARDALRGLAMAHERGIIHRDIKPGNILLESSGAVKLTDFGLATVADLPTVTTDGALLGTPAYMSPEQAQGEPLDGRTDLFSLGLTLVELLTGSRVCSGSSYSDCLKKILHFDLSFLVALEKELPTSFYKFLEMLLAPDRADRFQSAHDALKWLEGDTTQQLSVFSKRNSRTRIIWIAAGAIVVATGIASIIVLNRHEIFPADLRKPIVQEIKKLDSILLPIVTKKQKSITLTPVQPSVEKKAAQQAAQTSPSDKKSQITMKQDSGSVIFSCKPWAKVFLDNQYIGETPIAQPIRLPVGKHTVTFSNPHFVPMVKTFSLDPRSELPVHEDFYETAGWIVVRAKPWAKVYVDDQYRETTPLDKPLVVSSGKRRIRLANPAFKEVIREVSVGVKDTAVVVVDFSAVRNE